VEQQNELTKRGSREQIWVRPWKYTESFIIAANILILGVAIEAIAGGRGVTLPGFPINIYFVASLLAILVFVYLGFREKAPIKWLSGIPAAISAITIYSILVLLLGFIPQDNAQPAVFLKLTGLSHVKSSWPFLFIQFYFLIILGMVTLRRTIPFKTKNIGFILNHCGLWITILAAGLSSSDLSRLSISLNENETEKNIAFAENESQYQLPFSLKLLDFNIIEYNPKMGIFDIALGKLIMGKAQTMPFADKNVETDLGDWHLKVLTYLPSAIYKDGRLKATDSVAGYPAALVFARNLITKDTVRGWVSTGGVMMHPDYMALKGNEYLMLNAPEPKKFYSKIVVFEKDKSIDTVQIEVNKPYTIRGWTIYQSGYDQQMRKWSTVSVLEAVHDPWLPVVYVGVSFLLAGALYMFWIGRNKKE
jgi:hypothetical protein